MPPGQTFLVQDALMLMISSGWFAKVTLKSFVAHKNKMPAIVAHFTFPTQDSANVKVELTPANTSWILKRNEFVDLRSSETYETPAKHRNLLNASRTLCHSKYNTQNIITETFPPTSYRVLNNLSVPPCGANSALDDRLQLTRRGKVKGSAVSYNEDDRMLRRRSRQVRKKSFGWQRHDTVTWQHSSYNGHYGGGCIFTTRTPTLQTTKQPIENSCTFMINYRSGAATLYLYVLKLEGLLHFSIDPQTHCRIKAFSVRSANSPLRNKLRKEFTWQWWSGQKWVIQKNARLRRR